MPRCQIFTADEIASLRKGGKILHGALELTTSLAKPGVTTAELDRRAEEYIRDLGAEPGFKGYRGFPATLCTSINEETVHGIPGGRVLREGDLLSIDCGVLLDDLYTDACITLSIGPIPPKTQELVDITAEALARAIERVRPGVRVGDISSMIQKTVEAKGFSAVRALTGHGLGRDLHQFPDIPNVGEAGTGPHLPAGTIIAIEPIISSGSDAIRESDDGWTIYVQDRALTAHFEHTVLVTPEGYEILT
ncbi:MAG: type I methionyl aminopeptidase [Candidatus Peribacteraceae bacterium]|nr:type I methionyl aminopeptidase [Candidatus Peribacteraceae bacterium]